MIKLEQECPGRLVSFRQTLTLGGARNTGYNTEVIHKDSKEQVVL